MLIYSLADSLKICFIQNLCHNKKTRYQCAHCACMPYIIRKLCSQQMITFSLLIITLPQCYCIRKTLATIISSKNVGINKPKYLPSLFWTVQKWNFMNFNKRQKKKLFQEENCFQLSSNSVFSNSVGDKSNRFRKAEPRNEPQPWVLCTQTKTVQYDLQGVESHFWVLCFFVVISLGGMESINVAGVLQEAGDADSSACTRSQV